MTNYLSNNKKGIAIFMVLATILIVVVLANVILTIISNQSRLTRHEVNRIQAYYSAQAALIYTLEKIRVGVAGGGWSDNGAPDYYCSAQVSFGSGVCIDSVAMTNTIPYDGWLTRDGLFHIQVKVYPKNAATGTTLVESKVDYSYVP